MNKTAQRKRLKALRKKFGLGEFKKKRRKPHAVRKPRPAKRRRKRTVPRGKLSHYKL